MAASHGQRDVRRREIISRKWIGSFSSVAILLCLAVCGIGYRSASQVGRCCWSEMMRLIEDRFADAAREGGWRSCMDGQPSSLGVGSYPGLARL